MLEKLGLWMENHLAPKANRFAEQRHVRSIRDGLLAALPFIVTGSFFLLAAALPIGGWATLIAPYKGSLLTMFNVTFGLAGVYAAFMIGYQLASSYRINAPFAGLLSVMALIMLNPPSDGGLAIGNLGPSGLFVAIIAAMFAVEVYHFLIARNFVIRMPKGVPPAVSASFTALVPAFAIAAILGIVRLVLGIDLNVLIDSALRPLVIGADSLPGVMLWAFIMNLPWLVGIHAMVIVTPADAIWMKFLADNAAAVQAGIAMPHVGTKVLFSIFSMIGGSGCTLALVFFLLRARSLQLRRIGQIELIPALFNINEPITFGLPVVLNPIMAIPFILAPVAAATVTYLATSIGLVSRTFLMVPWALPNPIASYLATGGDWRAVVLFAVNLAVTGAVWYPFFKIYDKQLAAKEALSIDA